MRFFRTHLVSLTLAAVLAGPALIFLTATMGAQSISTAQLSGTVKDSSGAVIPNVTVTASDPTKGFTRTATTDGQGNYQMLQLPPGTYTVMFSAANFRALQQNNVILTVGEEAELPVTLPVGGVRETVVINANADVIETERSSQGTTIDQMRITNLPTNGRNYINFTLTNSQIARDAAPSVGAIPTSGLNFGGVRARSNSINVDGADAGDYVSGGTRATVSQDGVQEFQIITNGFAAEYGRASGGVVNIVTKSGANQTHASAFGFLRNRYIQATNPFSNVNQPAYTRVQAGFTLGGAIVPDKTFYFFSTELTRREESGFSVIGANTFGLTSIDVGKFYGAPAGALIVQGTAAQKATLGALPAATPGIQSYVALIASSSSLATTGSNPAFLQGTLGVKNFSTSGIATPASFVALNSLIGNFPIQEKTEVYSLRVDHKITGNQQLLLRASVSPSYLTGIQESAANQNLGENSFSRTATQRFHDVSILGQHTTLFGSNRINELRVQFSRHPIRFANSPSTGGAGVAVNIPGFAYFGKTPFSVVDRIEDQTQLQDNFTYTRGSHTFKTGVDLRYIPINLTQGQLYGGGDFSFAALNATDVSPLLAGLPGFSPIQAYGLGIPQSFVQGIGATNYKYDLKTLGAFLEDSWRMTSRITLNYGVRYDIEAFPTQLALNTNTNSAERLYGIREGIRLQDHNVAPRVGIAFDPGGDGKTVIRANYGLFYDRAPGNLESQSNSFNSTKVPLVILAGGSPCTAASTVSPLNLNATNVFQGSLSNANCLPLASLNYLPSQQRFDPSNTASIFVNQNYLAAGFPLAILPSGLPADLNYRTPYVQQISFGLEKDFGHDLSLNVAYNSTGGRHLNRPVNVNPVNPALLVTNWQRANAAVKAGTASVLSPTVPQSVVAGPTSNPLTVATAAGAAPCGVGPAGAYVAPPLLNFFRRSGLNTSLANFLTSQGAGQCVALAQQVALADGLGVGIPVPFGDMSPNLTTGTSSYNGLSVNLKKRFSANYEFLASYTWSHAIDDSTDVVSTADAPQNNFNLNGERGTSTFDQRHRFVLSGVYNTGHLTGRMLGSGFLPGAFSGFTVAPIIEISSGRPFNILTGQDTNFDFNSLTDRPNAVAASTTANGCGNVPVASRYSPAGAFIAPCYIDAPAGSGLASSFFNGNVGRNTGLKPYVIFTDLRLAKAINFEHHVALQITADAFNLINKNNTFDVNLLYTNAGQETAASDPRQFQFGARLSF